MEERLISIAGELQAFKDKEEELESVAGRVAGSLVREHGVSKSAIARLLGVSQPYVTAMIERAPKAAAEEEEMMRVPVLGRYEALALLSERRLRRVIAGFETGDVLLASCLDPELFRDGRLVLVPHMLWCLDDGWIGVDDVNVGYGGTGPRNAEATLLDAGVEEQYAGWAHSYRFFEIDLVSGNHRKEEVALYGMRVPEALGEAMVVRLRREDLPFTPETEQPQLNRPWRDEQGRTAYEAWLKLMNDDNSPEWMRGKRVARVFTSYDAAVRQGFTEHFSPALRRSHSGPYQIIIEQGRLQLWLPTYPPLDPTQLLAEEAYAALDLARLYPAESAARDSKGLLARYVDRFVRRRRPEWFDLSPSGDREIRYVPVQPDAPV